MNKSDRYDSLFRYYGEKYYIDWKLLKCQAIQESGLDPDAESPVGATGLMQFMPSTWIEWQDGKPGIYELPVKQLREFIHPKDPEDSISSGAAYMRWLLDRFTDYRGYPQLQLALASYNWGIGNVKRIMNSVKAFKFDERFTRAIARMPQETQDYVSKILGSWLSLVP